MELFKLFGSIAINNSEANRSLEETSQEGEKTQSKLSGAFGKIGSAALTVGKTIATGLAAGAAAMGTLTIKALNLSGELEQNMGGSEAVFAEYAGKMQETAKNAFSNMGLATSDFLATANKMGALFQGAGFSIKESSDLSTQAMQRAADVASIMGIDTSSAMEAIAGAAKGNFEMMDNLGVAMNDTTIQAYALSQGIDKSTKDMTNQEKIGLAMQMFLEKTTYAAGNYAKENDTLAGSLGTAKSALTNFLDGSGNVDQLVSAFSNAANVIIRNINDLLPRLVTGITQLLNQIVPLIPGLLDSLLPGIIEGAVSLINGLVMALPQILTALMGALPALISGVEKIFNALVAALPKIMTGLVNALPTLIPQIVSAVVSMILTLMEYLPDIIQPIIDSLPEIINSIVNSLLENLPALTQGVIALAVGIANAAGEIIAVLVPMIPEITEQIVKAILSNMPAILQGIWQILKAILSTVWTAFESLFTLYENWWRVISGALSSIGSWIYDNVIQPIGEFFKDLWDGITSKARDAWNSIKNVFSAVGLFFSGVFQQAYSAVTSVFSKIGSFFAGIWEKIKKTFSKLGTSIGDAISKSVKSGINGIISMIEKTINRGIGLINGAIGLINKLPGVNVSKLNDLSMPRLATGGVLEKGQVGLLEGSGAEAVVPLEKNKKWISKVAEEFDGNPAGVSERLYDMMENIIDLLEQLTGMKIYLDSGILVGELAPAMDNALGSMSRMRGRGN